MGLINIICKDGWVYSRYTHRLIKDLTDHRFGHLVVFDLAPEHVSKTGTKCAAWICRCDCGKYCVVTGNHLRSGHNKSCGKCDYYNSRSNKKGDQFDHLTLVKEVDVYTSWYLQKNRTKKTRVNDYIWLCKCDCGRYCKRRLSILKSTKYHTCDYCQRHALKILDSDMIGKQYGLLTVVCRDHDDYWKCKCDCGNYTVIDGKAVRFGKVRSCGCLIRSSNELITQQFLESHNLKFESEKTFPDLIGSSYMQLRYDFCVYYDDKIILLELNGAQHYKPVEYFGGVAQFKKQQEHDRLKKEYARKHGIDLYVIDCSSGNINLVIKSLEKIFS